ncbi:Bug family tripartite tricarboxylate transporter substrate binding protein [Roseomonas sp. BN140053]|uniref:Bug family tripartite tricarboxylate transporter substrate binding protein n=1 Tax=Roseomonas sp. BN140053 TaxID=3391898 RepID=UPI0039EB79B1
MLHSLHRRGVLAGMLALPSLALAQTAENWPRRPIRVVVPYAPGGAMDSSTRVISDKLGAALGQSIVIENRTGGSGTVGGSNVAQSAPDGYTFMAEGVPSLINPFTLRNIAFDYNTAFTPVTQVTRLPLALAVKTDLPARSVAEFIALAKGRRESLSCGHSGNGTAAHLVGVLLQRGAGITLNELPYRGGADAVRDLASGTLDCATVALLSVASLAESGRARILAVSSARRTPLMPDLPTLVESGVPDAVIEEWMGFYAPAGTPQPVIDRFQAAVATVLRDPEVTRRLAQLGAEPVGSSPAEFGAFVQRGRADAEKLVREAKIEVN